MAQITLVWTALPNGYAGNRPRLGVYVQPRLVGTPAENRLSSFAAFTSTALPWTQRVRQIPFQVWLDGQVRPAEAQFAPGLSDDLFRTLFPQDLPVRTFAIDDLRGHTVVTYPTGPVMDFLEAQYAARAAEPPAVLTNETAEVPDKGSGVILPPVLPELAAIANPQQAAAIDAALRTRFTARPLNTPGAAGPPPTGDPATRTAAAARAFTVADLTAVASAAGVSREAVAFRMVERYYTPTASATARRRAGFTPPDPEVDVHTVHGGLGDTPILLRNCGFAFDLLLPAGSLTASGTVRILPGAGAPGTQACPPMRYVSTAERFRPAPRAGSTVVTASGMLPLGTSGSGSAGGGTSGSASGGTPGGVAIPAGGGLSPGGLPGGLPGGVPPVSAAGAANAGIALAGPAYRVTQGDPDGTALKATASVRDRAGQGGTTDSETVYETGLLAAQRSAGLGVYRADRGAHLAVAVQRTADFDAAVRTGLWAPTPPAPGPQAWPLYADDVVAGYAVDVLDETTPGDWRSLCRRVGRYTPTGPQAPAAFTAADEGVVAVSAVALSAPTDAEKVMQAHDALFQWDGWSLAAPRPGLVLVPDDTGSPSPVIGRVHDQPVPAGRYERLALPERTSVPHVHLQTEFAAEPGTLPRLRFGRRYRLRARVVDVAGNVAVADDAHASAFVAYGRMEPLEPPTVALRRPLAEGESAERLVIRSDPGADFTGANAYLSDPAQYVARADVAAATASAPYETYTPTCERHLVPPAVSPEMVERHGRFDTGPWTDAGRREALLHVLAKASGTLLDATVVDVATGEATIPQPGFRFVTSTGAPAPDLSGREPGDPLPQGVYAVYDSDEVVVPYLPDPLARGVTFQHLPGAPGALLVPFDNTFPEAHAVRIRLSGTPPGKVRQPALGAPGALADAPVFTRRPAHRMISERQAPAVLVGPRVLDVSLPPASVVEVLYSTAPKTPGPSDSASTVKSNLPDAHDLFGPRRQAATVRTTAAARADLDRAVSGGLHEVVSPVRRLTLVHAVQRPLLVARFDALTAARPLGPGQPPNPTSADLTGQIAFHLASTGRLDLEATWPEPTDDVAAPAPRDGRDLRPVDTRRGHVEQLNTEPFSASRLPPGSPAVTPQGVARYGASGIRHEFGDTRRRTVTYRADATTRFRDYFHGEITQTPANLLRTGPGTTVTIPSSARPAAPDVRYVVPTFRWQTEPLPNGLLRRRCGGGLRIWLGRPWYSSGEGEQLGILVGQSYDNTVAATASSFDQVRSRWGLDPFWGGTPLGELGTDAFLTKTGTRDNLSVPNAAGVRMIAAAHDVHFDAERQLWYCDVELDTATAYMPFVRLVVARFQPESIPETHLSEAVVTDFVQTMPTRTAAVQRLGDGNLQVSVGGPMGNTLMRTESVPTPNASNIRGSLFTAALERQSAPGGAWMAVPNATTTLSLVEGHGLADGLVRARLAVPEGLRAPGTRLRVSVAEFDVHAADAAEGAGVQPGQRLVYADTLDLP